MIKTFRFALLACGLVGGALTATAAPAVPVRVATVELAPHAEERAIPGRVEAIRAVDIRARTEGVIVQRHFQDGQYVTATCCLPSTTRSPARRWLWRRPS